MEKPSSIQVRVGAFVGLCLLLAMISILMLGGNRGMFESYTKIYVSFPEVQGLFPGSVVSFGGIPVGNIESINYVAEKSNLVVEMKIQKDQMAAIRQGTVAEIRTQGALGDKYVYLTPGPADNPILAEGDSIEAASGGDLLSMLTSKDGGLAKAMDMIKQLEQIAKGMNDNGAPKKLMGNMVEGAENFKKASLELQLLLANLRSQMPEDKKLKDGLTALANVLQKLDKGQGTLGALINDPSIHQGLKNLIGNSPRDKYLKDTLRESIK